MFSELELMFLLDLLKAIEDEEEISDCVQSDLEDAKDLLEGKLQLLKTSGCTVCQKEINQ